MTLSDSLFRSAVLVSLYSGKRHTIGMTRGAQSEALSRQGPNSVVRLGAALDSVVWGLL
jgi:hypothetical protein